MTLEARAHYTLHPYTPLYTNPDDLEQKEAPLLQLSR